LISLRDKKSVFSSPFTQKNLGFDLSFCKIELNTMQFFLAKRYPFFILDVGLKRPKQAKKPKSSHPPHEKFSILDKTKHTHENFDILHFIIPK
jgi:hypothetical protein